MPPYIKIDESHDQAEMDESHDQTDMDESYDQAELDPEKTQEFINLCPTGDIHALKRFLATNKMFIDFPMFMLLCSNNGLELIKCLATEYSLCLSAEDVFLGFWCALKHGYSDLAWFLSDHYNLADAVFSKDQYDELFALSSDSERTREAKRIIKQFKITAEKARECGVTDLTERLGSAAAIDE
jgi:hypothetical protein